MFTETDSFLSRDRATSFGSRSFDVGAHTPNHTLDLRSMSTNTPSERTLDLRNVQPGELDYTNFYEFMPNSDIRFATSFAAPSENWMKPIAGALAAAGDSLTSYGQAAFGTVKQALHSFIHHRRYRRTRANIRTLAVGLLVVGFTVGAFATITKVAFNGRGGVQTAQTGGANTAAWTVPSPPPVPTNTDAASQDKQIWNAWNSWNTAKAQQTASADQVAMAPIPAPISPVQPAVGGATPTTPDPTATPAPDPTPPVVTPPPADPTPPIVTPPPDPTPPPLPDPGPAPIDPITIVQGLHGTVSNLI